MLYDPNATDTIFAEGRPPQTDLRQLVDAARTELGINGTREWRLLSGRRKMGKTLFEVEETTSSGTRRLIGKFARAERVDVLDRALNALWAAGFRPPNYYTVTEPVACLPGKGFILQEKAPGVQALDLVLRGDADASRAAAECAGWLSALHHSGVRADAGFNDPAVVAKWASDLSGKIPEQAGRIGRIEDAILRELADPIRDTVACHGDFHAMNIFIDGNQRITGIDLDKFSMREPESDIGYFLAQTASFGFFRSGVFDGTGRARREFLQQYREHSGRDLRVRRVGLYIAMAFVKNLHFELVLLNTGRTEFVEPWLRCAELSILEEDLTLSR